MAAQLLTEQEQDILLLLERRFSSQEIAATLRISWQTVATDCNSLYRKLRVTGRLAAVERAAALGLLPGRIGTGGGAAHPRLFVLPPQR